MSAEHPSLPSPEHAPVRRSESGWVLAATLVMSSLAIAVTVTYARHAILAKKSLEFGKGASEVEEASRSEMERVRDRMLDGDPPGLLADDEHDESVTPTGEKVVGEREVKPDQLREVRVRATSGPEETGEEFRTKVRGRVEPHSGPVADPSKDVTTIDCDTGEALLAGNLMVISGVVQFTGVELSGLMLLEDGAELTLSDCILRGTILTRHGACKSYPKAEGASRPVVNVFGGLRLLAGTEMPETSMCAPDALLNFDSLSRVETQGFISADELLVDGRATMRGMLVTVTSEALGPKVRRPGHGRGVEEYPEEILPGAEKFVRVVFPNDPVPASTLDLMASNPAVGE